MKVSALVFVLALIAPFASQNVAADESMRLKAINQVEVSLAYQKATALNDISWAIKASLKVEQEMFVGYVEPKQPKLPAREVANATFTTQALGE